MVHKGPERRGYIRVSESLSVSYTPVDATQRQYKSVAKSISGGGIKLPLKEELAVGTLLSLKLELLKAKKKIQFEARIVWVRPNPKDRNFPYEGGLEFINISSAERTMLSNYVQYLNRAELLKEFLR